MPDGVESNCAQELLQLVVGEYPLGCVLHPGRGYFLSGIEGDQSPVCRCFQGVVERGVDSPDGSRSQSWTTILTRELASLFQKKLVQLLQVVRCEFEQQLFPYVRLHVVVQIPPRYSASVSGRTAPVICFSSHSSSHSASVILLCSVSSTPWKASIFCRSLAVSSFWVSA